MIDKTKKYKTRDGRDVRIYATTSETGWTTHGAIRLDGRFTTCEWDGLGLYFGHSGHDFDLIPIPTLRPWTTVDAPKVVMLRPKEPHKEPRPRVWRSTGGGFACCVPSGGLASEGIDFAAALELYVRTLEDGSEVPCGVEE